MNRFAAELTDALGSRRDREKAAWLERYVKHGVRSLGVGIPVIRTILQDLDQARGISGMPAAEQAAFLDDLMAQEYTEPKLAAILFIQLYRNNGMASETLDIASRWFDAGWITDWNVCDWLCVRLLSPLVDADPGLAIPAFAAWNKSANLWKARASLVPFAQCKTLGDHGETIRRFSEVLIGREERFCKTAVGWVLREYSRIDRIFVREFLDANKDRTTPEVVRNATKYH